MKEALKSVRLLADIGGTNARFALQQAAADGFADIEVLACGDYPAIGTPCAPTWRGAARAGWRRRREACRDRHRQSGRGR
jgi:glucokinase